MGWGQSWIVASMVRCRNWLAFSTCRKALWREQPSTTPRQPSRGSAAVEAQGLWADALPIGASARAGAGALRSVCERCLRDVYPGDRPLSRPRTRFAGVVEGPTASTPGPLGRSSSLQERARTSFMIIVPSHSVEHAPRLQFFVGGLPMGYELTSSHFIDAVAPLARRAPRWPTRLAVPYRDCIVWI